MYDVLSQNPHTLVYSQYRLPLKLKHFAAPGAALGAGSGALRGIAGRFTDAARRNLGAKVVERHMGDRQRFAKASSWTTVQTGRPLSSEHLSIKCLCGQIEAPSLKALSSYWQAFPGDCAADGVTRKVVAVATIANRRRKPCIRPLGSERRAPNCSSQTT